MLFNSMRLRSSILWDARPHIDKQALLVLTKREVIQDINIYFSDLLLPRNTQAFFIATMCNVYQEVLFEQIRYDHQQEVLSFAY